MDYSSYTHTDTHIYTQSYNEVIKTSVNKHDRAMLVQAEYRKSLHTVLLLFFFGGGEVKVKNKNKKTR